MHIISHRGNLLGPNPNMENNPEYIKIALRAGYDVEVDVWLQSDGLYLGHDVSTYKTNRHFLQNQRLWVHCKNIEAYFELSKFSNINCFFHTEEDAVKTNQGFLWAHPKCTIWNNNSVLVKLDTRNWEIPDNLFGICTDYAGIHPPHHKLPFDLLIIDIDGVMTDGTKIYDREGKVFGKQYCDLDFTAIKRFKAAGINVCFFSGDEIVNKSMAQTRKIDFFHNTPGIDKADMLSSIKLHYNAKCIAYVGDDYYDLAVMNLVDLSFCPRTSFSVIKNAATIINVDAGKGIIAGLYDMFEKEIPYVFPVDAPNVNPK